MQPSSAPAMGASPFPPLSHEAQKVQIIFYLAYGSNLCKETFLKKRGIQPVSAANVVVPSLRLTFDLPGIPYGEPCFANSGRRQAEDEVGHEANQPRLADEKTPLLIPERRNATLRQNEEYHKDRWHKGLVGVVYGLTPKDYAHVIATEGAGASYQDITVPCFPLVPGEDTVPFRPATPMFLAHTLFAPTSDDEPGQGGRNRRPDPAYAQPSARYLRLLTDGAAEHGLPKEYADYLAQIRPYTITSARQRMGLFVFTMLWYPIIMGMFMIMRMFANKKGKSPPWAIKLLAATFKAVWKSYDGFFFHLFGDGERSLPDGGKAADLRETFFAQRIELADHEAPAEGIDEEKRGLMP